jgi:hypothetical protein
VAELAGMRDRRLVFFVDDNITSHPSATKELLRALIPLELRWVGQASINAAHDEELLSAHGAQRVPGRAHRLREPRPREPGAMNKTST